MTTPTPNQVAAMSAPDRRAAGALMLELSASRNGGGRPLTVTARPMEVGGTLLIACLGCDDAGCTVCGMVRSRRRRGVVVLACDRCGGQLDGAESDLCTACDEVWHSERAARRAAWGAVPVIPNVNRR